MDCPPKNRGRLVERWPFVKVRLYDVDIAKQTQYWNETY